MAGSITLTAELATILGGSALTGFVEVVLCGYGPQLPAVPGATSMLADAGIPQFQGPASSFSFVLYGNDVIAPAGTFYAITVFDENQNPIQTNNYIFTGTETVDLSTLTPTIVPPYNSPSNYITINPATGPVIAANSGYSGPLVVDMELTGNAALTLTGLQRGQFVQFIIEQNATGNWTLTWPSIVKNPPLVNPAANSITTTNFVVRANGNLYPALGWS